MDRADPVNQELTKLTTESERLDSQIQTIDSIQLPPDAVVLKEGTWTMEGDQVIFRSVAPYTPGQKVVIPYVVRSAQGEVLKSGYLPVESVRVDQRP